MQLMLSALIELGPVIAAFLAAVDNVAEGVKEFLANNISMACVQHRHML